MKKTKIICAVLAFCMLVPMLAACSEPIVRPPETDPDYSALDNADIAFLTAREFNSNREAVQISDEFRTAAANFAFKLLNASRECAEGDGLLVSPLSVMLALGMTANGAEGETLIEMERVLAEGMPIHLLNAELFNYTSALVSSPDAKFNLANSVWVTSSPTFSVNNNFIREIENTFDADVVAANFGEKATVDAINAWVRKETLEMIDSILNEGDVDGDTVMVLLNALAFDALWADMAPDESCREKDFFGTDGKQTATFMNTECDGYIKANDVSGIVKNYAGGNYAFVALMPDEGKDIAEYASSLDGEKFLKLFDKRKDTQSGAHISAEIPHFSFDCSIKLNDVLASMGMPRAFDGTAAEFGALGHSELGNVYISKVLHKTHIDLDNSGTRAAAVTAVIMYPESAAPGDFYHVSLDRPFVYAIVDTTTGLPIFLGTCENIAK